MTAKRPGAAPADDIRASFAAWKFDWLDALMADPRIRPGDFEIAYAILRHVNARSGIAYPASATIADMTGRSVREVKRGRERLRDTGWISWRRTRGTNHYRVLDGNVNRFHDVLTEQRDSREERRRAARDTVRTRGPPVAFPEVPPVALLNGPEGTPVALPEVPPMALSEVPPVAHKHLKRDTSGLTRSQGRGLQASKVSQVEGPAEGEAAVPNGSSSGPCPAVPNSAVAEMTLLEKLGRGNRERGLAVATRLGNQRFEYLKQHLMDGTLTRERVETAIASARNGVAV